MTDCRRPIPLLFFAG